MTKVNYSAADRDFMTATYPQFAGDKWDANQGGNMPTKAQSILASHFGVRLGSKQALALALTMRPDGSTAGQRTYAGQGKQQNNIGGLQDILRQQHKTAKLVAGQVYTVKLTNGAVFDVSSNKAGHVAAVMTKAPTVDAAPKVAAKVAAKAAANAKPATTKAKRVRTKAAKPAPATPASDPQDAPDQPIAGLDNQTGDTDA